MTFEAPPSAGPSSGSGNNPEQLADIGFYTGIGSVVLSLMTCIPFVSICTCFLSPIASIAAIVMGYMARQKLGSKATGQAADRAKYALYLGIGSLVVYAGILCASFALGFSTGFMDALDQNLNGF